MASVEQINAASQKLLDFSSAEFDLVALEQIMTLSQNPQVGKDQVGTIPRSFVCVSRASSAAPLSQTAYSRTLKHAVLAERGCSNSIDVVSGTPICMDACRQIV